MSVRVRFAPSPTGNVHIGNIRAAIFNWLFARNQNGKFLLRVEDTDLERSTAAAIQTLLDVMQWLGLDYDEETVYQSKLSNRHLEAAEMLLKAGAAYRDNSDGKGECIRFRMPKTGTLEFKDLVKGRLRKKGEDTQDFVIVRSDGSPVFHLANVVDDMDMSITHIIRGDDHVENTFKHIEIFKALGKEPPQYAHLPMIVNNQGKPYSKRDGAAFVGEFKEQGFLADALFNFLALLGWAPDDGREIFTRPDLIAAFSLDRCKASAARFDIKKLTWMNGEYIRQLPHDIFAAEFENRARAQNVWPENFGKEKLDLLLAQIQPRTKLLSELPDNSLWFLTDNYPFSTQAVDKRLKVDGIPELLLEIAAIFENLTEFTVETTEQALRSFSEQRGSSMGSLVHPIRVAISGVTEGPGLFDMLVLLGREKSCLRLRNVAEKLKNNQF